jgi:hypothetical protein
MVARGPREDADWAREFFALLRAPSASKYEHAALLTAWAQRRGHARLTSLVAAVVACVVRGEPGEDIADGVPESDAIGDLWRDDEECSHNQWREELLRRKRRAWNAKDDTNTSRLRAFRADIDRALDFVYPSQTRVLAQLQRARAEVEALYDEARAAECQRMRDCPHTSEAKAARYIHPNATVTYRDVPALRSLVDEKELYLAREDEDGSETRRASASGDGDGTEEEDGDAGESEDEDEDDDDEL